jgi:hypothetical protein
VCPRAGLDDVEEKILDPTGTRTSTSGSSSPQPVAILTELSRLLGEVAGGRRNIHNDKEDKMDGACTIGEKA